MEDIYPEDRAIFIRFRLLYGPIEFFSSSVLLSIKMINLN